MESSSHIERAVIVGAGLAGLTVAYHLRRKGLDPLLLDSGDAIGSSWRARHPQLTLNTHRTVSHLPGFRYPAKTAAFPKRDDVVRHLDAFTRHHDFRVVHGATVTSIKLSDGIFEITLGDGSIRAANVIVATGRDREPTEPSIEGEGTFTGIRLHAANFGDARQYRGKRVLVIGGGNSGFDVVNHLCRIPTASLWFSVRSGSVILPKRLKGIAVHRFSRFMDMLPSAASDAAIKVAERLAFGDIRKIGLPVGSVGGATRLRREGVAIPVDDGAIRSIKEGRTKIVDAPVRIDGSKVFFSNGSVVEPDYLIMATGFSTGLRNMLSQLDVLDENGNPPNGNMDVGKRLPGLWFAGMTPGLVSYFHNAGKEAKAIARAIVHR